MSPDDVKARLSAEHLPELLVQLGFADDDAIETVEAATRTRRRPRDLAVVANSARLLADGVGRFRPHDAPDPWEGLPQGREDLALLALLASVPEVRAEHARRRIPDTLSWDSLADLGQQVHVHRLTHASFGLDTYGWMRTAWSAGLLWLGRLQFVPKPTTAGWVLDVHIPRTGSLAPPSVDEAFALAVATFARHFPDYPPVAFACTSWLLDPALSELVPGSNLASFQQRWTLAGTGYQADESVLYFVFNRRVGADEPITLDGLPRNTRLERAVLDHLSAGEHWRAFSGTAPLPGPAPLG
ncbi:MAG: acyltransferase domain-containing protein [Beutenbergiaceae bacterium]